MKARPILPFFVALAAGFVGIFLFLQNVERGASNTASSVANITSPSSGATSVESPPRVVEHISAITARNPATVQPKSVQQTHEEPTLKELVVHRAHVEVGRIEGLVLVGNGPASATPVHVWEEGGEVSSDGELSAPSSTWSTTTMSDGSFAFEGLASLERGETDAYIVNFANADMVGHTGIESAARAAVRAVDECLARIVPVVTAKGGLVAITADHGNAEEMWDDEADGPHTAHTTNPVPLVLCCDDLVGQKLRPMGILADVVPTLCELTGLAPSPGMDGDSLLD